MKPQQVVALTATGKDRRGLIADISGQVTELGGNIVHVEQVSLRGLFSLFMLIEPENLPVALDLYRFAYELTLRVRDLGLDARAEVREGSADLLPADKDLRVITIVGSDRLGVMHAITRTIADRGANVERMHHVARGEVMAFEILIDVTDVDFEALRQALRVTCEGVGVDAVIQPDSMFRTRKRLVVFDMDSTIVDGEVIDELAKVAGVGERVASITERAMRGEMDFQEALRERVRMLTGLHVSDMERIAGSLSLTPGTQELIETLKSMGFKLALISGGFTFFTDHLKTSLGFDYTFANELEIDERGYLTGNVKGQIVDAHRKAEIMQMLADREGLKREEVVAIGDGANDRIMIQNAGLGIAFNAKEVLRKVADGALTKNNLKGLLYCLGATPSDIKAHLKGPGKADIPQGS